MTTPSQSVPTTGDVAGETSQADSGVDVGRPPPVPPDDTHPFNSTSPAKAESSNESDAESSSSGKGKGKKKKKFHFLKTMGKMFNHDPDLGSTSGDPEGSVSPIYSPRLLAEANFSPRGLQMIDADESEPQVVLESPRGTPLILHRHSVNTPPSAKSPPARSPRVSDTLLVAKYPRQPRISQFDEQEKTRNDQANVATTASPSPSQGSDNSDRSLTKTSSILKHSTHGELDEADTSNSPLKKDSHVQFKKEVRKVNILTDHDIDSEVSETVISINDSGYFYPHLRSNSSTFANAMLHALKGKLGHQDAPNTAPAVQPEPIVVGDEDHIDNDAAPHVDEKTPKQSSKPDADQTGTVNADTKQANDSHRKKCAASSMPNMRPKSSLADCIDTSRSIEVLVDEPDCIEPKDGSDIPQEATLADLILAVLLEVRVAAQKANKDVKQSIEETMQRIVDIKNATGKCETLLPVTPDLQKLLRSASFQIGKGAEAGNVRQVRQVLTSLLIMATESCELSGYEADGEDDTEKSSMFVQTSDDFSDDQLQKELGTGTAVGLPDDEPRSNFYNRVVAWRENLNNAVGKIDSSTDSDLSISLPAEPFPHNRVVELQEEEKFQEVDLFLTPGHRETTEGDESEQETNNTDSLKDPVLRTNSILKTTGSLDQLKKDWRVQFKDDVKITVISGSKDETEIPSIVQINDNVEHTKAPACDEDVLSRFSQYLSLSNSDDQDQVVPRFILADAMYSPFMKQLRKKSSEDLQLKGEDENSTFQNKDEIVHLDLPTPAKDSKTPEVESTEQDTDLDNRLSTSMPDIRPTAASVDPLGKTNDDQVQMEKSASIEVMLDDAQSDAHSKSQETKEDSGNEITNKLLNRVQAVENCPTDAKILPNLAQTDRSKTAAELYKRIRKAEKVPVFKANSTSSSDLSETLEIRANSTPISNLSETPEIRANSMSSSNLSETPEIRANSTPFSNLSETPEIRANLTPISNLSQNPDSGYLYPHLHSNSSMFATAMLHALKGKLEHQDTQTALPAVQPELKVVRDEYHVGISNLSNTPGISTSSTSGSNFPETPEIRASSTSSSNLPETPLITANSNSSSNVSDKSSRSGSIKNQDSGTKMCPSSSLNCRISATLESSDIAPVIAEAFSSDSSINQELVNWIIEEYEKWKECKKRGGTYTHNPGDRNARFKAKLAGQQTKDLQSSSLPCMHSQAPKEERATKSSGSLSNKLALSEIFGQLLLLEEVDTECGDMVEVDSLTRMLSDSVLSDGYADDEHSDTTDTSGAHAVRRSSESIRAEQQSVSAAPPVPPPAAPVPPVPTVPLVPLVPPAPPVPPLRPPPPVRKFSRPTSSPPTETNTGVILSSMKKSLEKLDLQLTGRVPFVGLTRLPAAFGSTPKPGFEEQHLRKEPKDHFPARDRLLQMIGALPVELGNIETCDGSDVEMHISDSVRGKHGERLLQLIRPFCSTNENEQTADDQKNDKEEKPALDETATEIKDTRTKVASEGIESLVGSGSDLDRNKLLKLITSPPREETITPESESNIDADWVLVQMEDVPTGEVVMKNSAEDIIERVINRLQRNNSDDTEDCCAISSSDNTKTMNSLDIQENGVTRIIQGIDNFLSEREQERLHKFQLAQISGASLPSSRVASPIPDSMLGTGKKKPRSGDVRNVIIEKELLESQLRKCHVEISTLHTENKLLKDKYNRSQARITQLETQLVETSRKAEEQVNLSLDASSILKRSADFGDEDVEGLEKKIRKLTREVDMLRVENASLEKQLDAAQRSHLTNTGSTLSDRSGFIEGWRLQVNSLREELGHVKRLLQESEESCQTEAARRKEASNQVIKLTELKALLQQQVEEKGGGTVAEKQVKSLETRLKITEERLHHERSDRAGKLSEVENKLINENARLQVSEKELRRQLQRERDRHQNVEQKMRDARAEVDRLRVAMSERPLCIDNMNPTFRQIITPKKVLIDERTLFEERAQRLKDVIEDLEKEKDGIQQNFQHKIQDLVKEKHNTLAQVKGMEDMNASLMAENDSIKRSLRVSGGMPAVRFAGVNTWEAQNEALKSELKTVSGYLDAAQRNVEKCRAEAASYRSQLNAKDQSLQDAMEENQRLCQHLSDGDLADRKQHKVDKLMAQITSLEREVERWQNKYNSVVKESNQLEAQVEHLRTRTVNIAAHTPVSFESDKLALEAELREKDHQVYRITVQYNEVENELQRTKQGLLKQQQISEIHLHELDQLQTQLRQKDRMLDQLSHEERQRNAETNALKENLSSVNDELTRKSEQMKRKEVDLEHNLTQRESVLSKNISDLMSGSPRSRLYADAKLATDTLAQAEGSVRLLQFERETMQQDIARLQAALEGVVHENTELLAKVRHLHQELVSERTLLCQTTADKIEMEHQLHICTDEKETLINEKGRLEADLSRHEVKLSDSIHKLQLSQTQAAIDYEIKYHTLNTEGKQLAIELGTSKRLLEARENEIDLLRDTIDHQKLEVEALNTRIELMKEDHSHNKEDVDRFTSDITLKMREDVAALETTQQLNTERSRLQLEKYQLEQGKGELQRKTNEVSDLHHKLDATNEKVRDAQHQLHLKDTQIVSLETELKHSGRSGGIHAQQNIERELMEDMAALNRDMLTLCAVTGASSLGQRLEVTSPRNFSGEVTTRTVLKEEMATAARQMEIFKHEYEDMSSQLQASKRSVNILKDQIGGQEDTIYRLEDNKKVYELEIDTLRTHLNEHKNAIDQSKKDKQTLYQDVQDMHRKLVEKEELLNSLQNKGSDMVDSMQKDYLNEKNDIIREKQALEERIAQMKDEIDALKSQLKQKEGEMEFKQRSSLEMEQEVKARYEAESNAQKAELSLLEAKRSLVTLQGENTRLQDSVRNLKEDLDRTHENIKTLNKQVRTQREDYSKELQELKQTVSVEKHKHDTERRDLQDQLNKAISTARTTEASLSVVTETKENLFKNSKDFERTIDTLKTNLHEEVTNRKLAEQRIESYKAQLEDIRRNRSGADEHVGELQAKLARTETELQLEKDKYYRLRKDMTETQSNNTSYEAQAQTLQLQVTDLQSEISTLRNQLETQRQNLGGKNKRLSLEIKQQIETYENERTKLIQQAQQLSVDLEQAREHLALKSRDNLKLKEEVLCLEGKLREASTSLRKAEDSLFLEKQTKEKFDIRNQELEIDVARLKTKMVDSDDPAHLEVTRREINKMMAELKRKMQLQFESQGVVDKELRAKELRQLEDSRFKISQLESALSQEQAMHIVTRTQLSSIEDDNQRLRTQLSNMRKRYTHGAAEERTKSKMEEINEIIARSQTRAQQLLASGAYGEDPLRTLSPSRDYLSLTLPSVPLFNTSHAGIGAGGVTPIGLLSPVGVVAGAASSGGSAAASSHDGSDDRSLSPDTKH